MSVTRQRTADDIRREIMDCESEAESLRDEAAKLDTRAEELADELEELLKKPAGSIIPGGDYGTAVSELLKSPELAEWERLRIEEKLAEGELAASEVASRFFAIGRGVPGVVFDQVKIEKEAAARRRFRR